MTTYTVEQVREMLQECITTRWEKHAKHESGMAESVPPCQLCDLFYLKMSEPHCIGCPIYQYTGLDGCCGTPYYDWSLSIGVHKRSFAQRELYFLHEIDWFYFGTGSAGRVAKMLATGKTGRQIHKGGK